VAVVPLQRGPRDRVVAQLAAQPLEHVAPFVVGFDLLERVDVGVDLAQHPEDAPRIAALVAPDAAVDVV
jgi:hypothetical protein